MQKLTSFGAMRHPWLRYELLSLALLGYFGWAIGDRSRIAWRDLKWEDYADLPISLFMMYAGFFGLALLFPRFHRAFQSRRGGLFLSMALSGSILYLLVIGGLMGYYALVFGHYWDSKLLYHTTPIFFLYFMGAYAYLYATRINKPSTSEVAAPVHNPITVEAQSATSTLLIPIEALWYATSEHKITYLVNEHGERYR